MTKSLPFALLAAGSLLSATAAVAATQTKPAATATATAHTMKVTHTTTRTTGAPASRMVTTKTATGKTVTYDCAKAGNATKTACKK